MGMSFSKNNKNNHIITLNAVVFADILQYLTYKQKFKKLLEISLLSKATFKSIQNIIINLIEPLYITLGSFNSIKSYIENNNNININTNNSDNENENNNKKRIKINDSENEILNNKYKYKLIQYKEIEYIRIRYDDENNDREKTNEIKHTNLEIKKFFTINCPKLSRVHLIKDIELDNEVLNKKTPNIETPELYDFSENGYFSFESLWIKMSATSIPFSNVTERDIVNKLNFNETQYYQYSYEFINKYNPRKVNISFSEIGDHIFIYGYDNLLNYKCISTLNFIGQPTTTSFIQKALNPNWNNNKNNISSLSIRLNINSKDNITINEDINKELIETFKELPNNSKIRKLGILGWYRFQEKNPIPLLEFLIENNNNKTLRKLDLEGYDITDYKLLEKLKQLPNITTLYYNIYDKDDHEAPYSKGDEEILKALFEHIKINPNITTLKSTLDFIYASNYFEQLFSILFSNFLNSLSSTSSLSTLVFTLNNNDTTQIKNSNIKSKIIETLSNNTKNNQKFNIIIKFKNNFK